MTAEIRVLSPDDAERYFEQRQRALADAPMAFAASREDDFAGSVEAVRDLLGQGGDSVVFGAFLGGLVGSVGVFRDRLLKYRHKARIWGMYVEPNLRNRGTGWALLDAAVEHARSLKGVRQVHLSVSESAPEAQHLYQRYGFRTWGTEPESICFESRSSAELHMVLQLRPDTG